MNQPQPGLPTLKKEIGRLGFAALALNGMIGAGIFALPAKAVEQAGLFSPWIYFICGTLIMLIVFVFARISSFFTDTGGPVTYATTAFGPFAGFHVGMLFTLSRAAAFAANAHLVVEYAGWFWDPLTGGTAHLVATAAVVISLMVINIIGLKQGMAAVFALTVLKLLPLCLLVIMGITWANPEVFTAARVPPLDSLGEVTLMVFYAFVGFESAVVPAGEARDARRDIPLALIRTILAVTVFYFLIQLVVVSVMPGIDGSGASLSLVAEQLMGPMGALLLTLGAVFSISGNLSASMLSAPRMLYAMAHHGNLPSHLGRVDPRFQTPANAVFVYGLLALGLALVGDFAGMAVMSTVVRLVIYVTCIAALPVLNRKLGASAGAFHLPGGMLIPLLALLMSLWLMTHASAESWLWTGVYVAIGTVIYLFRGRFGPQS